MRLVIPVVFLPTPPFFFANPRRVMEFPLMAFLPHIAHFFDIAILLKYHVEN